MWSRRYNRSLALLLVIASVALGACTSDEGPEVAGATEQRDDAEQGAEPDAYGPSPGCGADAAVSTGVSENLLSTGDVERHYRLFVPSDYDGETPLPLVVSLHGLTMTSDMQAVATGFEDLAERDGAVVVTPDGYGAVQFWNIIDHELAQDDVAFIAELLEELEGTLCIDTGRVYATGISNGALMSGVLACRLPESFAAIGSVAGIMTLPPCEDGEPVAVLAIHGTDDAIVPYEGGLSASIEAFLHSTDLLGLEGGLDAQAEAIPVLDEALPPVEDAAAEWAEIDGCAPDPEESAVSEEVTLLNWGGCEDNTEVSFYVVEGGGHTYPRGESLEGFDWGLIEAFVGYTTTDIDSTELIWDFFAEHQR
ncbi:MAG: hypothetical protein JJLCMIEE_02654 [Acidimicrobiales bacterium]|nr:hypothetical protein [Acidimicrobiales bacterium]